MNPIILLSSNGKVLYCPEWPEELWIEYLSSKMKESYEKKCEQAIANGIEFKDQEQIRILWCESTDYKGEGVYQQKMESLNPYTLPKGIEIEILCTVCKTQCILSDGSHHKDQFAFIVRKDETQYDLWEEVLNYCEMHIINDIRLREYLVKRFRIERIN